MKRKFFLSLVCAAVLLAQAAWAGVRHDEKRGVWIVDDAAGFAPVKGGNKSAARVEAQSMAKRDAVERAMGAFVSGVTVLENYEVVKDKVFSKTEGIVKKFEVLREKVDDDGLLTLTARCEVGAADLDGVLGPVMIDLLGNPRVMILVYETIGDKEAPLSTTERLLLELFEKAGYLLVDLGQARTLLNLDLENAYNNPEQLVDAAKTLNADVLVVGKAHGDAHTPKPVSLSGQLLWGLTSVVQLKTVLTDTAYLSGARAVEKRTKGLTIKDGVDRGFREATPEAARSIIYKVAYNLAGLGLGGGVPGITVKLKIADVPSLKAVESIEEFLRELAGKSGGVYRRRFENRAVDIDVVSEKNTSVVASALSEAGIEVHGTKYQVVSGRFTESVGSGETPSQASVTVRLEEVASNKEAGVIEDGLLEWVGSSGEVEVQHYRDGVLELSVVSEKTARA
ncbi:MAG: hypothetical protein LBS00_12760, partial [Synergistaceae bacterium]|nr:hypothetical protein [Synergistaceae bacterium]